MKTFFQPGHLPANHLRPGAKRALQFLVFLALTCMCAGCRKEDAVIRQDPPPPPPLSTTEEMISRNFLPNDSGMSVHAAWKLQAVKDH